MGSMPVVLMCPGQEFVASFCGVFVSSGIGPFAESGLEEAFCVAVGLRAVVAAAFGRDFEPATCVAAPVDEQAESVVVDDALEDDAEALEGGDGLARIVGRGDGLPVGVQGGEGDARGIVDSDVETRVQPPSSSAASRTSPQTPACDDEPSSGKEGNTSWLRLLIKTRT
ncbi:MAG: hypothetical protein ABI197_12550 [Granulicella sp.]